MKLSKLSLINFKGIKEFSFDADGKNVAIYGDNGTGKTTVCDSVYWLLFDKDSQFKKQFEIKTLTLKGLAIPGLNHEVEGVFITDSGKTLTLKKSYSEIWTKKRGDAQKTFTGHTTDYYIDEVPVKKKEYAERAAEYFVEETFKLLTTPTYFAETLPWKDRRELLLTICGNISDDDVIKSEPDLKGLKTILGGRFIDDQKKVIANKKAKLNDEIKQIPVRIDEANRTLPTFDSIDVDAEKAEIKSIRDQINEKEKQILRIESGSESAEQTKKLRGLESELIELQNAQNQVRSDAQNKQRLIVDEKKSDYLTSFNKKETIEDSLNKLFKDQAYHVDEVNRLRELWHQKNNTKFIPPNNPGNCPTCGQSIPEDQRKEVEEKALSEFNLNKSKELEKINLDGTAAAKKVDELDIAIKEKESELADAQKIVKEKKNAIELEEKKLSDLITTAPVETDEMKKINAEITEIKEVIHGLESGTKDQTAGIEKEIETLYEKVSEIETKLSSYNAAQETKKRIADLGDQERTLAGEIENLESQLFLIEKFIIAKVELLESSINSKFEMARFKLFKSQINGGLDECCEVLHNGIPFNSGLNNGARINIGLDIIKTLSEHYKTSAPIFIDNAESVTEINAPENSQVIQLVVSKPDKVLRVE